LAYTLKEDIHGSHATILRILKRYPRGKVLEVGCADGFFSEKIAAFHEVWGVEVNSEDARKAGRFCKKVYIADIEEVEIDEKFNIVLLADVLEHTRNPKRVLRKVAGWLAKGGIVIVSLPNVAHFSVRLSLLMGTFAYTTKGILDSTHLRFFTQKIAEDLFNQIGFTIIERDITPLPLLEILNTRRGRLLDIYEEINYHFSKLWKTLFAYQFIFVLTRA
jgi:2-polyprenyl-3-methyl-5-hydroxy-6-metoxy-1,4-benzoquinol methylase